MLPHGLDQRVVAVTGAGRGLGLAIAERLGRAGNRIAVAEIDPERGERAVAELRAVDIEATFVQMDVAEESSVEKGFKDIADLGLLRGLINNAALADGVGGKYFHDIEVADWDRLMGVNVRGTWLASKHAVPLLQRDGGRIINLASDAALYGSPRLAHYVASKGAIVALTKAMARELGPRGITVNAVAPGLTQGEAADQIPEERHDLYRRNRMLSRDQQPDDITGIVNFLLSDEASYITGQLVVVDGGFVTN